MNTQVIIFDCDGTITDVEKEGAPFLKGYYQDLAILLKMTITEVEAHACVVEEEVMAYPSRYRWDYHGYKVAPQSVDPYLRIIPVSRRLMKMVWPDMPEEFLVLLLDRVLYRHNYRFTVNAPVFRKGARELLESLNGTNTYVVTNSDTKAVASKIRILGSLPDDTSSLEWLAARIHGNARKNHIATPEEHFDAVPEKVKIPGLRDPVQLRRSFYYSVLNELRMRHEAEWSDMYVIGDIYELDGSLPLVLGAHFALLANSKTPAYERKYVAQQSHGKVVRNLSEVPAFLRR